jgi:hypothetical protein
LRRSHRRAARSIEIEDIEHRLLPSIRLAVAFVLARAAVAAPRMIARGLASGFRAPAGRIVRGARDQLVELAARFVFARRDSMFMPSTNAENAIAA